MATENRLIFYSNPPSLKNITSSRIAIHLWRNKIISGAFECMYDKTWKQLRFHNTLPIPGELVSPIDDHIAIALGEIKQWVNFIAFRTGLGERLAFKILKIHFDEIVWHLDSTIDDVLTAKKMLTWPELSLFHKLRISSLYCFVEDVQKLRPLLPPTILLASITYEEDPLLYYWEHRYKDDLEGIVTPNERLNAMTMINNVKVDRWTAIEYLYDHAEEIDKENICSFIILHENVFVVKNLLEKLNEVQLKNVITRHAHHVMVRFLVCPESRWIASQTWDYFKDKIDEYHFYEIIRWILKTEVEHSQRLNETLVSVCIEIWAKASDHLQNYVFYRICANPPKSLFEYKLQNFKMLPRNMKFFIRMLSDADYIVRNYIWIKNWPKIIQGARPIYLHDLLKMCMDEDQIDDFKEILMLELYFIKGYCIDLVAKKCYHELDAYLTFCTSDKRKILLIKQEIILDFFNIVEYSLDNLIEVIRGVFKLTDFQIKEFVRLNFTDDGEVIVQNRVSNPRTHFNFLLRLLRSFFHRYLCL